MIYGNDETNYETHINGSITEQYGTYEVNVVEVSILPYTINHTVVITKI